MAKKGKTARPAARKPENPREALAWLHTIAAHIGADIEEYEAHEPPVPVAEDDVMSRVAAYVRRVPPHKPPIPIADDRVKSYFAAYIRRAHWLSNVQRLRWFFDAVETYGSEKNKKSLPQLLGLIPGRGRPRGRKPGKSLDLAREIFEHRETKSKTHKTRQGKPARTRWKEVGRDHDKSDQAARKLLKRALPYLAEEDANEFVARLKQRQKPPPIGKAKARSATMGKKIRARNRRKR
jgi:hypothetical protein